MTKVRTTQLAPTGATGGEFIGYDALLGWVPKAAVGAVTFTTKGDLIVGTGAGTFARLAAGTNGWYLKADSSTASGLAWAAIPSGLAVQDENVTVASGVSQIDFQGAGVTATAGTGEVVVTIPGDSAAAHYLGAWSATPTYAVNDVVTRAYGLYVALAAVPANQDPSAASTAGAMAYGSTAGTPGAVGSATYVYSSFVPSVTQSVGSVTMDFATAPSAGQVITMGIVSASPGATPTYLRSATVVADGVATSYTVTFSFITLTSGTSYYVEAQGTAINAVRRSSATLTGVSFVSGAVYSGGSWGDKLSFTIGLGGRYWTKIANLGVDPAVAADSLAVHYKAAWNSAATYAANDVVSRAYGLYVALAAVPVNTDPVGTAASTTYISNSSATLTAQSSGIRSFTQPFTPTASVTVDAVVLAWKNVNVGSWTGSLRAGIAVGDLTNTNVATATYLATTDITSTAAFTVDTLKALALSARVSLTSGTVYTLAIWETTGTGDIGNLRIAANAGQVLTGATLAQTYNGTATTTSVSGSASYRLNFQLQDSGVLWAKIANTGNQQNVGQVAASGAAVTIASPESQAVTRVVLSANCTITAPPVVAGQTFRVTVVQDGTGGRTLAWAASPVILWPGGVTPVQTATALKGDLYEFTADGSSNWLGRVLAQNY